MASSSYAPVPTTADDESAASRGPPAAHMATTTVKVDGMTCGACTSSVESAFKDVPGAGNVSVSLVMGRAVVHHDPSQLPADKVAELIEDRGFDAQVLSTDLPDTQADEIEDDGPEMVTTTLAVEGMTCGACTSAVEGGLKEEAGVRSINVSLLSERAVVEHDPSVITPEKIAEVIEDRGFGATVLDTKPSEARSSKTKGPAEEKPKFLTTTVSIDGMTCGACTSSVQRAFDGVDGLLQFNISLLAERAVIAHDPLKLSAEKIVELIDDAGFDARIVSSEPHTAGSSKTSKSVNLSLYGLTDAAAATSLEETVRQKPGIISISISVATSRASVSYNSSIVGIRSIVETIEAAGFNALVSDSDDNNAQLESLSKTKEIQEWRRAFLFSLSFAIPVFLLGMIVPMYLKPLDFGKFQILPGLYLGDLICLVLTIPVQFGIGMRFYVASFKSLKHRSPTMDVLVMLGTSSAFFFSVFTMFMAIWYPPHTRPHTVFDTSTMLITFITLGRWLENRAKGQTSKALSRLMSLTPSMATIYEDPIAAEKAAEEWETSAKSPQEKTDEATPAHTRNAGLKTIPTELIEVGDVVVLRPGDKVSADGIIIRGESYVDESMITGEAIPIHKKKGSLVIAGTVNTAGSMDFKVTRAGRDTQLSQIVNLVQEAQTSRAPIQRMADVVAGYFVPTIISLGLITFIGWMILSHILPNPPKIFNAAGNGGKVMVCLKLCISVIVFACPCALGLSTPTAVMVGTGVGAENGILVKGGAALEAATKINHVVFDKTGTLTVGKMSVAETRMERIWSSNDWRRRLWWLIVGLAEMGSEHPVGRAIVEAAKVETGGSSEETLDGSVGDFEATIGKGISAVVEPNSGVERTRYRVLLGNASFLRDQDVQVPEAVDPDSQPPDESASAFSVPSKPNDFAGLTLIHVAVDGQYAGTISLRDSLKPSAVAAVAAIHRMGFKTSLITGDTYSTALSVAKAVGIPPVSIRASVSPSQKQTIVAELQAGGDRVAMVGDGVNDSPALATASVGIALASGTDVAMEAADIVLMRPDDLLSVPASFSLARSIFNRIRLNLMWACVYNVIGLPFAMGLFLPFGGITLHPMAAGAAMAASSVSVVVSSLLLKFWSRPRWMSVERLEKEVQTGKIRSHLSRDLRWTEVLAASVPRSPRGALDQFKALASAAIGIITGKGSTGARGDEGYIPLQTVEPV
ncbi:hypothetical protein DTO166G4_1865 [Paecilomyces variotii]|nr:hypothetical protein DTO166G4_1865 [Paecilomyces variotii]KAJ9239621.1 hypothetical protein DTO166G5_2368 [Paecilomyces variotii]